MTTSSTAAVIIVAAGSGTRFGSELPKQFCPLAGKPVVIHAIERFRRMMPQARIIVVLAPDRFDYWERLAREWGVEYVSPVAGGTTRWESVKNAISLLEDDTDTVLVHDGARPLVKQSVVKRLLEAVSTADGALPVLPLTDSIRVVTADGSSRSTDRAAYRSVQTPQAFPARLLREAYERPYAPSMTDDASVIEAAGYNNILLCEGSDATLKITRPLDIALAALYLQAETDGLSSEL